MKYMLDTNICVYAIKHKPEVVFQKLQEVDPEDVCISSVTYAELVYGVEKSAAVEKNRLGPLDMMIAGHAKSAGLTIVTNHVKKFSRVADLKIENWAE